MNIVSIAIMGTMTALGAYFSYSGMGNEHGALLRYTFWFFAIQLFLQMIALIQVVLMRTSFPGAFTWYNLGYANIIGGAALAFLVFGCFATLQKH